MLVLGWYLELGEKPRGTAQSYGVDGRWRRRAGRLVMLARSPKGVLRWASGVPWRVAEAKRAGEQLDLEEPGERRRLGGGNAYMVGQEGDTYGFFLSLCHVHCGHTCPHACTHTR